MKRQFEIRTFSRPRLMGTTRLRAGLLSVGAMLMAASLAQGAKPGGVAVLLPPFIPVQAPQPVLPAVSPFDVLGFVQSATVDTSTDPFSAGWLEVNGLKIRVPRNTLFQMPATAMTWTELFTNAPQPWKGRQSGLALTDTPKPLTDYEVHVIGNRVINPTAGTDLYIAGLIYISQQSLNNGAGIINAIDYSGCTGARLIPPVPPATSATCMPDIWVGSTLAAKTGARIRLNTPGAVFGAPDPTADVRFTADEGNPTMVTRTGYPMCIPRFDPATANDSLCPQWNRPRDPFTGAYSVNYTFPAATGAKDAITGIMHQVGYPNTTVHPDPFEQTPMEVGDYISYAGNAIQDVTPCVPSAILPASSCQYISAHTVTVELGLYTAPGTWPVYANMSEFVFGVGGTPNPIFPQEAVEKIFGDFFTTDSSQLVDIYSEDINSSTGAATHRFYGSADPFGPPLGGVKGRARFRVTVGNFLPPSRNMAIASRALTGGAPIDSILPTARLAANGMTAGFYTAPHFGYIFAENLVLGTLQIPNTFQEFPFLANGSGPYCAWPAALVTPTTCDDGTTPLGNLGQLSPWPGLNAPPALANSTGLSLLQPPVANAGPPQTVLAGSLVNLSAAASVDPNVPALPLIYTWQQLSGPPVIMQNVNNTQPLQSFLAPTMAPGASPAVLTIQLAVCNGFTCGGAVTTTVTVTSGTAPPPVSTVSLGVTSITNARTNQTTFTLTASCGGTCPATLTITQTAGTPARALSGTGATRTFTVDATKPQTPATFTAKLSATGPTASVAVFDTITVTNVSYQLSHSRLAVALSTNALPKGTAVITVTPLLGNKAIAADQVLTYDPVADSYNLLADIVNPIPDGVTVRSSYGGLVLNSPVTRIQ